MAVILVAMLAVGWFFRFQMASGFTLASGDRYDAMIEIAIEQHWRNVIAGHERWDRMAYFYPAMRSIGYNDGYFLYGLLYAAGRSIGLNIVAAAEAVHVAFRLLGFAGMFALLGGPARCRWRWSAFGAALFTIADISLRHVNHAQLLTVGIAPWCALFAWRAGEAFADDDIGRFRRQAIGFVVTLSLWLYTAYYLAWFFIFFLLLWFAVHLVLGGRDHRIGLRRAIGRRRLDLTLIAVVTIVLLAPFLDVYLPKVFETGMRGFGGVRETTLTPLDYLNPGTHNLLWSGVFRPFFTLGLHTNSDDIFGIGPALFGVSVAATLWLGRDRHHPRAIRAVAIALIVAWLLLLRIWVISPWYLVHALVPGAAALRVLGRFQIVLIVPAITLATMLIQAWRSRWKMPLAALLLVEQGAVTAAPVHLDERDQLALLASIPPPPARCRAFAVRSSRPYPYPPQDRANDALYAHNVEAMTLAEQFARPTINGFSSFNPPGWNFADPERPDYLDRVRTYAAARGIDGLCLLDIRRRQIWTPLATR